MTRYKHRIFFIPALAVGLVLATLTASGGQARDYEAEQNYYFTYGKGPGSLYYWEYGKGPGSAYYWEYGQGPGSAYYWEYGKGPASRYTWRYGKGPGSRYYWQYGKGERSLYAWRYGKGGHTRYAWTYARYRVISHVMTALCLSGALDIAPCRVMRRAAHHHRRLGDDYVTWYQSNGT